MNGKNSNFKAYKAIGFTFLLLGFLFVGLTINSFLLLGNSPPDIDINQEIESPDGRYVATFYTISGGGAAGYVVERLKIMPRSQVFKADEDYVFEMRHAYKLDLEWRDDDFLIVTYPTDADVHRKLTSKGNIKISYASSSNLRQFTR